MATPVASRDWLNINVVGTSGSGKSTLARRLAAALGARHVELDALFWRPGWQASPDPEFLARIEAALAQGPWVLDGNYTRTIPVKWREARTVIWLDYGFGLTLWRAARRALARSWSRSELWPGSGNRESFRKLFSRDSILLWTLRSHAPTRRRLEALQRDPRYAHLRFIRLRHPREAEALLAGLASGAVPPR
ncbi:MAG: AAA family ATPase [Candidatus Dactylopiibacterium sp.]|nr:AAA family ATPase [Candidatus Dactylopiibacterium sp.]